MLTLPIARVIIPISKLLGNYNLRVLDHRIFSIIPISKLLGNYNIKVVELADCRIIPISKLLGNYNNARVFN